MLLLVFQYFEFDRTWWKWLQKHVVGTNFDISFLLFLFHMWYPSCYFDQEKKTWIVVRIFYNVCFVDRCFSFWNFSFGHCVVCSSSIYGFCLPLLHLQTRLSVNRNHRILERVTWNRLYFGPYIAMEATT